MKKQEEEGHTQRSEEVQPSSGDERNSHPDADAAQATSADVKNASAAGMGAMGRNDERLSDPISDTPA